MTDTGLLNILEENNSGAWEMGVGRATWVTDMTDMTDVLADSTMMLPTARVLPCSGRIQ